MRNTSWLIRDGSDRERMLDMEERLRKTRPQSLGVMIAALLAVGPWYGWWLWLPVIAAGAIFGLAYRRTKTLERPELALFIAWVVVLFVIAAAFVIAGAPAPLTPWFVFPIVPLVSRFSARGVALGVAAALAVFIASASLVHGAGLWRDPPLVVAPGGVIIVVGIYALDLLRSDSEHRSHALLDELTGMLNRKALSRHVEELEQQSALHGLQVALVVTDIDHFKQINDQHGHNAGDAALREVAALIRHELRAHDHAFRLGGEEFLMLLPGADPEQARSVAERVRAGMERGALDCGLEVRVSCGLAVSEPHARFDYAALFARADAALYEAKAGGRNCVREAPRPAGMRRALAVAQSH